MLDRARHFFFVAIFLIGPVGAALAAPPASCAYKFIGTWVYAGGTTVVSAGGVAFPKCAMCVPTQTWTCQGNTYLFSNSGPPGQFSATLSADGRQLISGGIVATRVGGAARGGDTSINKSADAKDKTSDKKGASEKQARANTAKTPETKGQPPPSASEPAAPQGTAPRKSASCSDITGASGGTAPNASHCRDADRAVYAARQIRQKDPQVAAVEYKKAAASARRAGDTTLELSILREAMEAAGAAGDPPRTSSASEPPKAATAAGVPRMWDGSRETCRTANDLEKNTAGWFVMCSDAPPPVASTHRPQPDPLELSKQARQACGSYSRDTQQCFADFKLKLILAGNPGLKETCEKKAAEISSLRRQLFRKLSATPDNRERFLECVDNIYLYGNFDGPPAPKQSLRETLRKGLAGKTAEEIKQAPDKTNRCWSPGRCCQAGHGLKPTPGAFGAWSCQPLGLIALNTAQANLTAEQIEDLESRVNEAVASAVAAAVEAFASAMSERDREVCTAAAFAAVHARLKGGTPEIPEQCLTLVNGARGYFAAYADGHVNNTSSAMEDLVANFRSNIGGALPGMIGLTPDETARRDGECMRGERNDCN